MTTRDSFNRRGAEDAEGAETFLEKDQWSASFLCVLCASAVKKSTAA